MKPNSSRLAISLALLFGVVALSQTADARKIEGFESGDPAVSSTGDAGNQGTFQATAPPEGSSQYLLTTINSGDGEGLSPVSGTNAVSNSALQTFFHNITLAGGFQGSGVLIPFTIAAGETILTFQFDFLSNEPAQAPASQRNDFAFAVLFDSTNTLQGTVNRFATVTTSIFTSFGAGSPFIFHTGVQTATLSLSGLAPGMYTIGIGVDDAATTQTASGILIDNFQVVPEPSIMALAMTGAALLFAGLRWRAKRA
jgi:hypothetical protein